MGTVYYPSQPSPMELLNSEGEPVGVHTPTEENLGMILESIQWSDGPNPEDATPGAEPLDAAEPEGTTPVAAADAEETPTLPTHPTPPFDASPGQRRRRYSVKTTPP